jgi:hypothetical protein
MAHQNQFSFGGPPINRCIVGYRRRGGEQSIGNGFGLPLLVGGKDRIKEVGDSERRQARKNSDG